MGQKHSSSAYSPRKVADKTSPSCSFKTVPEDSVFLRKMSFSRSGNSSSNNNNNNNNSTSSSALRVKIGADKAPSNKLFSPASFYSEGTAHTDSVRSQLSPEDFFSLERLLPESLWEAQRLCREDERVRRAFADFVSSFCWLDELCARFAAVLRRSLPAAEVAQHLLFGDYLVHPRSRSGALEQREREEVAAKMTRCAQLKVRDAMQVSTFRRPSSGNRSGESDVSSSCFSAREMPCAVLAALWPLFRASPDFSPSLSSVTVTVTESSSSASDKSESSPDALSASEMSDSGKSGVAERVRRLRELFYHTVVALSEKDLQATLLRGDWAQRLLDALDDLPIPLSVGAAQSERRGFPLMFVNRAFERMSQYERSEVLGRSCRLLQSARTDREYIRLMSDTLARGLGVKLALSNMRKDRTEFMNLLALRPVLDREGVCSFVLGVQCDVSREDVSMKDLRIAEDFQTIFSCIMRG